MNKTELLLQMMQRPQDYTADEWQAILADEQCRELYTLMSKTQSAFDAARAETLGDDVIDAEWQRLTSSSRFSLRKMAASFIGLLVMSGVAFAALHIVRSSRHDDSTAVVNSSITAHRPSLQQDTVAAPQPVLYDNVLLEQILAELAEYYNVEVVYSNEAVRQLRLFYHWRPEYSLEKVVGMLDNFETLHLQLEADTLIVSSADSTQP